VAIPRKSPAGVNAPRTAPEIRIGISGWTYPPWRGTFYPPKWVQKRELDFASRQVNSIEINGSFYSLQLPSSYRRWYDQTPENFIFAVKGGRFITHLKRLQNVETPLANFFASGVLQLKQKLGPILWQLPPNFVFNPDKLARFFALLPRDLKEADSLARKHDQRVGDDGLHDNQVNRPIRHAIEVRHATFAVPAFIELLRSHQIGLVIADTAGKWPFFEDTTTDFVYVRLHGDEELYVSGYSEEVLNGWQKKIEIWSAGKNPKKAKRIAPLEKTPPPKRDVYVYFDNDVKVRAPYDAMLLANKLGVGPLPPEAPDARTITESARTVWPKIAVRAGKRTDK
jgi:uncharacterized protein YecE (DUF72 family)